MKTLSIRLIAEIIEDGSKYGGDDIPPLRKKDCWAIARFIQPTLNHVIENGGEQERGEVTKP